MTPRFDSRNGVPLSIPPTITIFPMEILTMLSQKARYALRALIALGSRQTEEPMLIADIAEEADVPRKFLEQILLELKKRGIVHSHRGKFGGYTLGRVPDDISFAEVIRTIDGPLALTPCASRTAFRRCDDCKDEVTCAIRKVLLNVRDATSDILESHTLAHALADEKAGRKTRRKAAIL
jgi:Rrf2 family protein